jgi:methyl-accepting chemotaxis protein
MASNNSIESRLAFAGMDGEKRKVLREIRPQILKFLPGILDGFYAQSAKWPETAGLFRNPDHMRHAKAMQIKHWEVITAAEFSEAYVASVTRIGETHNRLGLEPRWYIGGYSMILEGLIEQIEMDAPAGWFGTAARAKKARMLSAITTAVLLDMDFAISVYLDAGRREKRGALEKLASSFDSTVGVIVEAVSSASAELESAAGALTRAAESTQQLSTTVAAASEQASANVQSVASASEELAASVGEIARQVEDSSKIANEAVQQARSTDMRINQLSQAAGRIGDVVKLITSVAEQTNLLALNATIEAARAGEAGRGFAVVAQEVKALAAQTAKATDEIGTQITGMQTATGEAVVAIGEISATIERIAGISAAIAAAVEEQGAATREISRNVQQAAQGTTQVASNIVSVNAGASETGAVSSRVFSFAQSLSGESSHLKDEVGKFLETVRAA